MIRIARQKSAWPELLTQIFKKTYEAGSVKFAPMVNKRNGFMRIVVFCENRTDTPAQGSFYMYPTQGFLGDRPEDLVPLTLSFHLGPGELQAVAVNYPVPRARQGERASFDIAATVFRANAGRLLRLVDGEPLGGPASGTLGSDLAKAAVTVAASAAGIGAGTSKTRIMVEMPIKVFEACEPELETHTLWLPGGDFIPPAYSVTTL